LDWGASLVALAGIAASTWTALASLRQTRRGIISPQAQVLYEKRLEAYCELFEALSVLHSLCLQVIYDIEEQLSLEQRAALQAKTGQQYKRINDLYRKWAFVLPLEVSRGFVDYFNTYSALVGSPGATIVDEKGREYTGDPNKPLGDSFYKVANLARADMRVEALGQLTSREIREMSKIAEPEIKWMRTSLGRGT
jgi:hypothetical protein